jgi:aryl-alcohol dehydrogenase-like predicted oxidoreductase
MSINPKGAIMSEDIEYKVIGKSGLVVPAIGTGIASWGEPALGYGNSFSKRDVQETYRACVDRGVNFFDTAAGYGDGESERLLGECRSADGRPIVISTKYSPPTIFKPGKASGNPMQYSLAGSLERLGVTSIDLFTLHFPPSGKSFDKTIDELAEIALGGKVRAVGISNFGTQLFHRTYERLERYGVTLASIQSSYNLLQRYPEENGLLKVCRELGVSLIATGPLAQGILTGKHRGKNTLTTFQRLIAQLTRIDWFGEMKGSQSFFRRLVTTPRSLQGSRLEPLFLTLEEIGQAHGKSTSQVALKWLMATDPLIIPIPGAKSVSQAIANCGVFGWELGASEYIRISEAERNSR